MDNEQPSSIQSICHVRASELFPKSPLEREDKHLQVPFKTICGEAVEYLGRTADGVLALSNYRIYLQLKDTYYNIPLGLIEVIEVREIFYLYIGCKDGRSLSQVKDFTGLYKCSPQYRMFYKRSSWIIKRKALNIR
ncbi:hypothetical protein RUM43_011279 [Polyplax serrata]|uniref:Uncharacterized protein n=1 Tax=Polyplax serrata TaxID=468196 RepID=A0AAN8P6T8_POLSC